MDDIQERALELVEEERHRQISEKGWTADHDDTHTNGELSRAAACYVGVTYATEERSKTYKNYWPWNIQSYKPSNDPKRNLIKAAALILADLERLLRKEKEHEYHCNEVLLKQQQEAKAVCDALGCSIGSSDYCEVGVSSLNDIQAGDVAKVGSKHFQIIEKPVPFGLEIQFEDGEFLPLRRALSMGIVEAIYRKKSTPNHLNLDLKALLKCKTVEELSTSLYSQLDGQII